MDSALAARLAAAVPLGRAFYARPPVEVAEALIGTVLVHESAMGLVAGRLVETEAYDGPQDRASHARFGRTARTSPMSGPPGHAYVYLVYGLHHCLNVVTSGARDDPGGDGDAGAVLLRAAGPLAGLEVMRARRGRPHEPDARLASGPGRLGVAFGIDRSFSGVDLTTGALRIVPAEVAPRGAISIARGPRIGVAYAGEPWVSLPWRLSLAGDPSVSR